MSPEFNNYLNSYIHSINLFDQKGFAERFPHANFHYGARDVIRYASIHPNKLRTDIFDVYKRDGVVYYEDDITSKAGYQAYERFRAILPIDGNPPLILSIPQAIYNSVVYEWTQETMQPHYLNSLVRTYGLPHALSVLALNGEKPEHACNKLLESITPRIIDSRSLTPPNTSIIMRAAENFMNILKGKEIIELWNQLSKQSLYENKVPTEKVVTNTFMSLLVRISSQMLSNYNYNNPYELYSWRKVPIKITQGTIHLIFCSDDEKNNFQYGFVSGGKNYFLLTAYVNAKHIKPTDVTVPFCYSYPEYKNPSAIVND